MTLNHTIVIDVVGLSSSVISRENTPYIYQLSKATNLVTIEPAFPAITCVPQTTYLTGQSSGTHGIVGNGYYDKDHCEIRNWHQSSKLIKCKRIFDIMKEKDKESTVFSNCWWFSMYDKNIDYLITPRPQYLQDGGKLADIYTAPSDLRNLLQQKLGTFPLHKFWGPLTSIESSKWIANASKLVDEWFSPTLQLIYLPHLDYSLQKYGCTDTKHVPSDLKQIDLLVFDLVNYYKNKYNNKCKIMILSEYGIQPVNKVIHINKVLRENGFVKVRKENGGETLDCGISPAFALSDHQIAHIYTTNKDKETIESLKEIVKQIPGVQYVLDKKEQNEYYKNSYFEGRSGDLIAIADENSWFSYYYWNEEKEAPDFARCVAIHRKPGYDPAEMFFRFNNPIIGMLYLFFKIFLFYILRIRTTVDASPLNCDMIKGSHGIIPKQDKYKPVLIKLYEDKNNNKEKVNAEEIYNVIFDCLFEK